MQIQKYSKNPVLIPISKEKGFEKACVFNPGAVVKDGKVFLLYRAENKYLDEYISRIGLASSEDGFLFKRYPRNPVIDADRNEEKRGCEDPRVIKVNNNYFLTYGAFPGGSKMHLCGAFSRDLIHWDKIGILIPGREKAGAIVQDYRYNGKYVMYFGEGVVRIALSNNLKNWEVMREPVLKPRPRHFDSHLVEGGPPPIVTKEGIIVIYNSSKMGIDWGGEKKWQFYSAGMAIFDKNNPSRLIYRTEKPILEPTEYWEKYGKANYVVFATGLVFFKEKWLLYYGGADKSIGVAIIKV